MRLNTTLMTSAALLAMLAAAPVLAQDTTTDTPAVEEPLPDAETGMDADGTVEGEAAMPDATTDADMDAAMPDATVTTDADMDAAMPDATVTTDADMDATMAVTPPEGFVLADMATFTADQLLGVDIYGPTPEAGTDAEFVGNITDLVLDEGQAVSHVITDVGGFLGIGQKSVALPTEAFTLFSDGDGNLQGHVTMTREEIEALPEYVPPIE